MKRRPVLDVAPLPDYGFGPRMLMWWGTLGFVTLEGMAFALAIGAYLFLAYHGQEWPIAAAPPNPVPATLLTLLLLFSLVPNALLKRRAERQDMPSVRLWLLIMCLLGLAPLAVRAFEFANLNVRWDANAYGSILWTMLGLHTAHLLTDVVDTLVLTVLMFTRHGHSGTRFSDVTDNCFYWSFVVLSWLPIYALVYWAPRL